ncbi:enoyl-CoA hydratase/isomerase family protein [Actinomadura vinacea]|uniref:Enoyl-CoA hydratase/isomerase family protein n=1 Tax=Actinomadura vinacea TaxID=115336 RepID=A0ABN3KAY4_9ACTN
MSGPLRVSMTGLADGAADGPLLDEDGAVLDPLVAVDLERPRPEGADAGTAGRAVRRARASDRLLVGVLPAGGPAPALVDALDFTLAGPGTQAGRDVIVVSDTGKALQDVHDAVTRNPRASLVLRDVLRATEAMPVSAALDVESYAYSTLLAGPEFARWLAARGPRPRPPEAAEPVLSDRAGDLLHITLNRPERRNAYGRQVRDALVDALRVAVLDDGIGRVVLDGAGPSFCAGGDLDEFGTTPDLVTAHLVRTRGGAGRLLHRLAERTEVRVHGACVGAGIELPAFAGTLVASPGATFRLPEVSMGLIPGAGGTVSVPRRVGRHRALHLALTGAPIDAATALAWGLVDEIEGKG